MKKALLFITLFLNVIITGCTKSDDVITPVLPNDPYVIEVTINNLTDKSARIAIQSKFSKDAPYDVPGTTYWAEPGIHTITCETINPSGLLYYKTVLTNQYFWPDNNTIMLYYQYEINSPVWHATYYVEDIMYNPEMGRRTRNLEINNYNKVLRTPESYTHN
jgi:hypothetical protein